MKEQIYTIPVNEAYDTDCECPLCILSGALEKDAVNYALGAAMMEPDYREASNRTGYCSKHFSMMFQKPNKLSLALVLDTHLEEVRKKIAACAKQSEKLSSGGLFKKSPVDTFAEKAAQDICTVVADCMVCEKINHTMEHYLDVLFYMWANDDVFRKKFQSAKGTCLPHLRLLLQSAANYLKQSDSAVFIRELLSIEQKALARIQDDIHKFTLKFDYRNQELEWGTAKDAPQRTIEKLSGKLYSDGES